MLRHCRRLICWKRTTKAPWLLICVLAVVYFIFICAVIFNMGQEKYAAISMSSIFHSEIIGKLTNSVKNRTGMHEDDSASLKKILFWNSYFSSHKFEHKLGHKSFRDAGCRISNCLFTDDRNLLNDSDAVIFHANDFDEKDLPDPRHRRPNQRFIFYNYETMATADDMPMFTQTKHFFNWTMTYRRDSDIYDVRPHGALRRRTNARPPPDAMPVALGPDVLPPDPASIMMSNKSLIQPYLAKKTKMVAWFVSNCRTDGLREKYFQLVGQHVTIDTFGRCGNLTCEPSRSEKCDKLLDGYKFYVAAENAICADYVTEKFYRALAYDIVPVVYGGADYSAYAPPTSYINAADFKSPKALATYLKLLDENDGLYLQYFDWKKDYEVVRSPVDGWCQLCEKLNDPNQKTKVYQDMIDWWFHKDIPCLYGKDFLKHVIQDSK